MCVYGMLGALPLARALHLQWPVSYKPGVLDGDVSHDEDSDGASARSGPSWPFTVNSLFVGFCMPVLPATVPDVHGLSCDTVGHGQTSSKCAYAVLCDCLASCTRGSLVGPQERSTTQAGVHWELIPLASALTLCATRRRERWSTPRRTA